MRVLCIGDLHEPCTRPGYLEFCKQIQKKYKTNQTMFMGDVVDNHAISFHAKHPEMPGPKQEYDIAHQAIQKWYKTFPKSKVCIGNHCNRIVRLAESVNIPAKFLRDYAEIWDTPTWDWGWEFIIDDVCYQHGIGSSGMYPAYNTMRKLAMSCVLGHNHSCAGIKWLVNPSKRLFGMDVGTGILDSSLAFAYGQHTKIRSVVSVGVVIDGHPYLELMPISKGEDYHDTNFK